MSRSSRAAVDSSMCQQRRRGLEGCWWLRPFPAPTLLLPGLPLPSLLTLRLQLFSPRMYAHTIASLPCSELGMEQRIIREELKCILHEDYKTALTLNVAELWT